MKTNHAHTNRLIDETSTYLLQHAHNPVDWYPWGPEALAKSRQEEKPILLSVGYAACHWCHVMAHESFEDEAIATIMNANFVCIKVDREERTDLDEIYMKAVQVMTGHGGWPMTVFLTPSLKPFFGGTYYPPEDRHGMPSFRRVLLSLSEAWKTKREEINESATEIADHLISLDNVVERMRIKLPAKDADTNNSELTLASMQKLLAMFDNEWGGFGSSPKFPHSLSLDLAMRCAAYFCDKKPSLLESLSQMITTSLDKMAEGGINDQIGGGFARYSVDRFWLIPHFEKMLYDNALLCQTYLAGFLLTGREYWRDVAENILAFAQQELQTTDGAFYSSLDADSEGEEGKYYVWKPEEIAAVIGSDDAAWFCSVYGVTKSGNFEHGSSVLHLTKSPEQLASENSLSPAGFWQRVRPLAQQLLASRRQRVAPGRDEKVLTSWNSLLISAFVDAFRVTGKSEYLDSATKAAHFITRELCRDGRLLRTWGSGQAKLPGYLDDYAFFVASLLDLASVDGNPLWSNSALALNEFMLEHFSAADKIGFFYTSDDHEELLVRPRSDFDGAVPSASALAVFNLLRLAKLTDKEKYRQRAEKAIAHFMPLAASMPDQLASLMLAADFANAKSLEIVVVGTPGDKQRQELLQEIYRHYLPYKIVIVKDGIERIHSGPPEENSKLNYSEELTVLAGRGLVEGRAAVYVCENFACDAPITSVQQLAQKLAPLSRKLVNAASPAPQSQRLTR